MWDGEAVRHIVGGLVVAGHRVRGRPSEVVMQHLSQRFVVSESDISKGVIETGNRTAIHFAVLAVATVHLDDGGLVTKEARIRARATECLSPISGESLDVLGGKLWLNAWATHVVGHHDRSCHGVRLVPDVGFPFCPAASKDSFARPMFNDCHAVSLQRNGRGYKTGSLATGHGPLLLGNHEILQRKRCYNEMPLGDYK